MPAVMMPRPTLRSFRVQAVNARMPGGEVSVTQVQMSVQQDIQVGLSVPSEADAPLMARVSIKLHGQASLGQDSAELAQCACEYEAQFLYPVGVSEEQANALLDERDYQYVLVAQAFPLAMTHFRRELQALGLEPRGLPLGVEHR